MYIIAYIVIAICTWVFLFWCGTNGEKSKYKFIRDTHELVTTEVDRGDRFGIWVAISIGVLWPLTAVIILLSFGYVHYVSPWLSRLFLDKDDNHE